MTVVDTDFLIDLANPDEEFHARAAAKAHALEEAGVAVYLAAPSRMEVLGGAELFVDPPAERARLMDLLRRYPTYGLTAEAADLAGSLDGGLRRARVAVGLVDVMIAAIAIENDETLLTRNLRDFRRVPGLRVDTY